MNGKTESLDPAIVKRGAQRLVGASRLCKGGADCHQLWLDVHGAMSRILEEKGKLGETPYYALCSCAAGAQDGAFNYMAAMPAADGDPVPEGMTEFNLPESTYAQFSVAGLGDIGRAWAYTGEWLSGHPEWKGFCDGNPERCGCVDNPSFELYPPGFAEGTGLFILVPIAPS